jgi:hypothetical protein
METFALQKLFGVSRVGKVKQWQPKVIKHKNDTATIIIESGYVGGKIQSKIKLIKLCYQQSSLN